MSLSFRHALFTYHLIFSLIFFGFIIKYGGDALGYWTLQADSSQAAGTWMQHFGLNTFFIQWLNYIPSKILHLPFWAGNIVYGLLTAFAWVKFYDCVAKQLPNIPSWVLKTTFLLPNMHFWTAGVSKESLIWVFLVFFFVHMNFDRKSLILMCLSILGMVLIRPIYASFLIFITGVWGLIHSPYPKTHTYGFLAILSGVLALVLWQSFTAMHLSELSVQGFQSYIDFQMQYLGGFEANSYVRMETYSFPLALFTFFFRPFPWEGESVWFFLAGIENIFATLLFLVAFSVALWKKYWESKPILVYGLIFLILLGMIGSQVLNNFGILMRYKSVAMIFLYLWAINTVLSVLKLILAKQINK